MRKRNRDASNALFVVTVLLLAGPLFQWWVMGTLNDRYIARLMAKASAAKILERDQAYVISVLGEPNVIRRYPASTTTAADGTVVARGAPYTSLRYRMPGYLFPEPYLVVTLRADGRVGEFWSHD